MTPDALVAAARLLFAGLLFFVFCAAKTRAPGQETVWDQILEAQAARGLQNGAVFLQSGQYDRAIREFSRAVLSNPSDPMTHVMLGVAYYWTGQVDRATAEYREALRLDPESAQAHQLLGIAHAWKGDIRNAFLEFQESARLDPLRADVQMDLGAAFEGLGRSSEAMRAFREAVRLDPKNPLYHFQLGVLYRRMGRDDDAADSLRRALRHFSGYEDALLELGAALERLGRLEEAREAYEKCVRLKPRDSAARFRLARLYLLTGRTGAARDVLKDAFPLTPEEAGGSLALSVAFSGGGRETPVPSQPDGQNPAELLTRNLERVPLGQDAKLEVQLAFLPSAQLVQVPEPAHPPGTGGSGSVPPALVGVRREFVLPAADAKTRSRQIERIRSEVAEVLKQAPQGSSAHLGMNLSYARPGSGGGGFREGPEGPRVSYQPRRVGNDLGLWVLGTSWMNLVEEALPEETGSSSSELSSPTGRVAVGLGHAILGNGQAALGWFTQALESDPSDELALLGQGVARVEMGDEAGAISAYRRVLQTHPKNPTARDGLKWLLREKAK